MEEEEGISRHLPPNRRKNPLSIQELQDLLSGKNDAAKVLLRVEASPLVLERLLKDVNPQKLVLTARVLAKAINAPNQNQAVINVLNEIKMASEFLDHLRNSIARYEKDQDFIKAVLTICKRIAETFPNNALKVLAELLLTLEFSVSQRYKNDQTIMDEIEQLKVLLQKPKNHQREQEERARVLHAGNDRAVDPNLFRGLSIIPTAQDFDPEADIEYRANKIQGAYENINDYLDIQFRLLRADLILPLRKTIMKSLDADHNYEPRGVQVYYQVRIVRPICHDKGLCFKLSFDVSKLRRINWAVSQRLKYGSLLCLSIDNFNTYVCAVVENREPKDLAKGLVDVQFVLNDAGPDFQLGGHEEFVRLISEGRDHRYTMVESPTYFEAYKYVLLGLQHFTEHNFPFWRYIGECNPHVDAPLYLQNRQNVVYDLRPLVDTKFIIKDNQDEEQDFSQTAAVASNVDILNINSWPNPNTFSLDISQYVALQSALTKEFCIIQGPPGTGKTHIGLLAIKALLQNRQVWLEEQERIPILLVCYTNHALDQFLEGILEFYQGFMVRVGSRSKSEKLEEYNLRGLRSRARENRSIPLEVHIAKQETRIKMKELKAEIHREAARLDILEREIVKESFLQGIMKDYHYDTLTNQGGTTLTWLGIVRNTQKIEAIRKREKHTQKGQNEDSNGRSSGANDTRVDTGEEAEDDEEDNDLLEMINTDLPQTRHLDIDDDYDDDDDGSVDDEENEETLNIEDDLFAELAGLDDFMDNIRSVNKRLDEADIEAARIKKQNIAFNISEYGEESMPRGLSKSEKKHWKGLIPLKKKYRTLLLGHLQKVDRMSEDEANQLQNVWKIKMSERWRLYRYWVDLYCRQVRGQIRQTSEQYEQTARRYQEILHQEDKTILAKATIIGMTTTGAARYQGILREIGPKIILVEEAAEVLEGHVITSLTNQCQHVILIGDHKQLRPNPSVYELKKKCGLDISLFERLIGNKFPYDCLRYQHRMRPEISHLLRLPDLYPDLQDHELVKGYPDVLRIKGNVCFIQHNEHDEQVMETNTFTNEFEADFIIGLCEYLIQQGQFKPMQITILSPYAGQIHLIKNRFEAVIKSHRNLDKMKGVKISSVDNYQGNENEIILLSLVRRNEDDEIGFLKANNRICVALSRAKVGLYVIGNFDGLGRSSPLIQEITRVAHVAGYLKDHIALTCIRHSKEETIIKCPEDFKKVPEGGCMQPCEIRLKCGHCCKRVCHADDFDHQNSICTEKCRHLCQKCKGHCQENHRCGQHDVCRNLVDKVIPMCQHRQKVPCGVEPHQFECQAPCGVALPCGHRCENPCGTRHDHTQSMCRKRIEVKSTLCGHNHFEAECGKSVTGLNDKCPEPCGAILECGHPCTGSCGQCFNQRLHKDCKERCKKILICGHECQDMCSSCSPCRKPCETACSHSRCPKKCGELCPACVELCCWNCKHYTCQDLCCQPCARVQCDVQCPLRLPCGHICSGLCGEKCPRLCNVCDKEKLINESLFGYDGDPTTLFVELDCGHVLEVDFVDQWMKTSTASSDGSNQKTIGLKPCPRCKTPIRKCSRYNTEIKTMLCQIERVKRKYIGENSEEKRKRLDRAVSEIRGPERESVDKFLQDENQVPSEVILEAQLNQVNLFRMILAMQRTAEECSRRFQHRASTFRTILQDLEHFRSWVLQKRVIFTEQNKLDAENERDRVANLLDLTKIEEAIKARNLQETIEVRHLRRLTMMLRDLSLYQRPDRNLLQEATDLCQELRKLVPDTHIVLTAAEKMEIVRAVNVSQGAWYQCPNGHIYAIGECGRAMEVATCPECHAKIGGTDHNLLDDNTWTGVMDNAEQPIWDNAEADRQLAMQLQHEWEDDFLA